MLDAGGLSVKGIGVVLADQCGVEMAVLLGRRWLCFWVEDGCPSGQKMSELFGRSYCLSRLKMAVFLGRRWLFF